MEADGVTLSDDEVRERFSAFHDGELSSAEAAFVRKRLDEDKVLAAVESVAKSNGYAIVLGRGGQANSVLFGAKENDLTEPNPQTQARALPWPSPHPTTEANCRR